MVTVALLLSGAASVQAEAGSAFGREDGFFVGCNYWASHAGVYMWRDWRPDQVERDLDRLASCGMTVVRVFPLWPDFQPLTADFTAGQEFKEYSQAGGPLRNYAAMDDEMIGRFRFLCDAAEKRGIRLVVGLITGWMSGRTFVPTALERMKVLSDPRAIIWEVRFVRYFVNALKDHKAITAWDLGNECNCMGVDGEPTLWAWMHQIASEIRLCDPSRPVVSGMHGCTTKASGIKNIRHQGELVDILTTHPYPLFTPHCNTEPFDTIRNGCHAACETTLYADLSGRTAFVEEAGSIGPQIVSEARAAGTMRMQLFSTWACGHPGYLWWCGFDQNGLEHAPYDWTVIERELGLFKADGTPKPTALALKDFKSFVESLPFGKLPARRVDAVVVASESVGCWDQMQGAWLLSRMAGFDIRYAFAEGELPESRFYILPSTADKYNAYSRRAFWRVMGKAKDGATVLVTLGDGAILSDLEEVAGIRTETHYARNHSFRVKCPKGEFEIPETYVRDITPVGCEILTRDTEGRPVMTVHPYGKGKVVFFNGALETNAQMTGWPAYALAASEAGVKRRVTAANPLVGLTEHPAADGAVWVVAVNYGREAVRCPLSVDGRIVSVHGRAKVEDGVLSLGANDGCVIGIDVRRGSPAEAGGARARRKRFGGAAHPGGATGGQGSPFACRSTWTNSMDRWNCRSPRLDFPKPPITFSNAPVGFCLSKNC